jgi:hypothetical protein
VGRARSSDEYVARNQGRRPRRLWELLPEPVVHLALDLWNALPRPVRRSLAPLGRLINRGHSTEGITMPGASSVSGVDDLRREGFTPVEELTGFVEVAMVWPDGHRRSVPETREWWLGEPLDAQLWLVRPPWPGWTLDEVLLLLWSVVDDHRDHDRRLRAASDVLRLPEVQARAELAKARADRASGG